MGSRPKNCLKPKMISGMVISLVKAHCPEISNARGLASVGVFICRTVWRDGETDGLCGVMDSGEFPSTGNLRPSMLNRASENARTLYDIFRRKSSDHRPPFQPDRIVCRDSNSAALTVSQRAQADGSINSWIANSVHVRRSRGSIASISQHREP